jgi:hypothetical protein
MEGSSPEITVGHRLMKDAYEGWTTPIPGMPEGKPAGFAAHSWAKTIAASCLAILIGRLSVRVCRRTW